MKTEKPQSKMIVFSGIRPSGVIHIGNYLGAIKQWLEYQKKYQSLFSIVDYHALTTEHKPEELKYRTLETAAIYLAAGLDPKKTIIFIQSHVGEHTELAWILGCITKLAELERMTQFKEKAREEKKKRGVFAGLLNYPLLMAADILLYDTDLVPVGEDQTQHLELVRHIARTFNKMYGITFKEPQTKILKETARIMSLDDPWSKMSKTAPNPNSYIALTDSAEIIRKKIKSAVTDSGRKIIYNEKKKPAISNLMRIYSAFSSLNYKEIENKFKTKGYAEFKNELAELLIKFLTPLQKKIKLLLGNDSKYLEDILVSGASKARILANKKMAEVRKKIGVK